MSEMHDWAILQILQTATIAAVEACDVPTLPVKYVARTTTGGTFEIPNDQKWLEVVWLPNNRSGDYWGDEKNYRGTLRLVLHWPNNDAGAYEPMQLLSQITSPFTKGTLLQDVQIYDNPDSGGVLEMGAENLYPASIRYTCFRR
jgi:hypothetical protein